VSITGPKPHVIEFELSEATKASEALGGPAKKFGGSQYAKTR